MADDMPHNHGSSCTDIQDKHRTLWPSEVIYHGQSYKDALHTLPPRFPVYRQMPGELDCPHYMKTRTCNDHDNCKFDHPLWVPEGGIPELKGVPMIANEPEPLPERPGLQPCPLLARQGKCKYGQSCRYDHPKSILEKTEGSVLLKKPLKSCSKFNDTTSMLHHLGLATASSDNDNGGQIGALTTEQSTLSTPSSTPAVSLNSVGLPGINHGPVNQASINQTMPGSDSAKYPRRPGQPTCDRYMKRGKCSFGKSCKLDHPPRT